MSKPCDSACFSRMERTSSTIGSFHINLLLKQPFRSANHRAFVAGRITYLTDLVGYHGISQVGTIPRHQKIHCVYCCYRNMCGVRRCSGRNNGTSDKQFSQRCHVIRNLQFGDAVKQSKTFFRCLTISTSCLVDHQSRNEEIEPVSTFKPPLSRDLLVRRDDQIPGGSCGQVAGNRRFYVNLRLHAFQCTSKAGS
jgi:hypothetical protein